MLSLNVGSLFKQSGQAQIKVVLLGSTATLLHVGHQVDNCGSHILKVKRFEYLFTFSLLTVERFLAGNG